MKSTTTPFIIWTLQRTGGTNLAQRLFERSNLPGTQHEPFNISRTFGHITEQWNKDNDKQKLDTAVHEIVNKNVLIKHCVEMVPWAVTEALIDAATEAGYKHLFLYRRNVLDRLLSLQFAKLSGIWGPDIAAKNVLNEKIFAEPLPIKSLVQHEKKCIQILTKTWTHLKKQKVEPLAVAFEDIYQSDDPTLPQNEIQSVLESLGLSFNQESDQDFVATVVGKGDQGTRRKYHAFAGINQLEEALSTIALFDPKRKMNSLHIEVLYDNHPWILHAAVDALSLTVENNHPFEFGGVLVLSSAAPNNTKLEIDGTEGSVVQWDIKSPYMAVRFPEGINCQHARFKLRSKLSNSQKSCDLVLKVDSEVLPLFRIKLIQEGA